jgi:hypothetical protein
MNVQDIASKYEESFSFLQAKKKRQAQQLVLLNNIRRGEQFIASTLLLTLFNRILASLYDDKLQIKFLPSQGINQDQINSYNLLAQSDYLEMNKAQIDYDWCWDTLFFGRGYVETLRFDKKRKIMQPHVINPLAFGYDPYFDNPQYWRYYWKWITKNKWEIEALIKAKVIKGIKSATELPGGVDEYLWMYKTRVDQARDGVEPPPQSSGSDVYQILEFFCYNDQGKKSVYWTDRNRSKIIYEQELDLQDGEEILGPSGERIEVGSKWPIVMKEAFREPHSSVPFSVADLLEDKHRAKSVLLNLAYIAAKDQANPLYGYNPDKVRDTAQFFSRQINQHIPMDGPDAAWPLAKAPAMTNDLLAFINVLTQEANEPVGTGTALQPDKGASETATEVAIEQQLNDLAQSLQSKVLQFGESEFWSHWFHRYAKHSKELGEKMANIVGVKGVDTKMIDLKDFNTDYPPGVMVYSAKEAEYKELVLRRDFMQLYPQLAQTMNPDGLRNFNKFVFFPKFVQDPSLIDIMFPKTLDEMKAEEENEQLKLDEMVDVAETDDHTTHIYTHYMVQPKTWATWVHLAWHEELLAQQKKQEMMNQQMQMQSGMGGMGEGTGPEMPGQLQVGAEKQSPLAAASSLRTETQNSLRA